MISKTLVIILTHLLVSRSFLKTYQTTVVTHSTIDLYFLSFENDKQAQNTATKYMRDELIIPKYRKSNIGNP